MSFWWLIATAGGAFLLGVGFAYALLRNRPLTPREQAESDRKTRELYHDKG
jgi:hypothetical protein